MSVLVPVALYGWAAVVLLLFSLLPPRRAVVVSFVGGWLLLPSAGIAFPGLPDLTKVTATAMGTALGVVLFDCGRLLRLRPRWFDLPVLAWCIVPIASSLDNGLGLYDGLSFALSRVVAWGVPWVIGRAYFDSLEGMRELALGIVVGGLLYVPLALLEVRLSPQLHRWVYGFHPSPFGMTMRFGGFRPVVFMQHGLMLGLWMTAATLLAAWLWMTRSVRTIRRIPMSLLVGALAVTTVLCKSAGAVLLLAGGLGLLAGTRAMRSGALIVLALALVPGYIAVRTAGLWHGEQAIAAAAVISEERAGSLAFRLENEDLILSRARQRPLVGWGGWGRWRVRDELGNDITTSDGLWVIAFGETGAVGLAAFVAMVLLPVGRFLRAVPGRWWGRPEIAPAAALSVLLVSFAVDCLMNAMPNPIYMLGAGGLAGAATMLRRARRARRPERAQRVEGRVDGRAEGAAMAAGGARW